VRTIGEEENTLFCIFEDDVKFMEYYDLKNDPEQLKNIVSSLSDIQKNWYQMRINHLKQCQGKECHYIGNL